jgi:hypothetical protein
LLRHTPGGKNGGILRICACPTMIPHCTINTLDPLGNIYTFLLVASQKAGTSGDEDLQN